MDKITIGEIIGAFGLIATFIGSIKYFSTEMKKYIKNTMKEEIEPLRVELNKNSLNTMKNTICNDNIPLEERISVGREYIAKGGNGAVKVYLHKLETEFEKRLQGGNKL